MSLDLHWISCQPLLLEAMRDMDLPGYRSCGEAPRRPGGQLTPDRLINHFHGVPLMLAATWEQFIVEGRKPEGFTSRCRYCTEPIIILGGSWTTGDGTTACTDTSAPYVPHRPKEACE